MRKHYLANVWKLSAIRVVRGSLTLSVPTIVGYWLSHGMTMRDVMVLQSIFSFAVVVLEIPSGYLADVIGRKRSILWGSIATLVGEISYATSNSFNGFLVAELSLAVGLALISGADLALLYDSLLLSGEKEQHRRGLSRLVSREMFSFATFSLVGGLLAIGNPRWPFIVAACCSAFGVILAATLHEPVIKRTRMRGHGAEILAQCRWSLIEQVDVRHVIMRSALLFAGLQAGLWLYQPYLEGNGLSRNLIGFVFATFSLTAGLSTQITPKLETRFGLSKLVLSSWFALAAGYFLMSIGAGRASFVFILIHQLVRGASAVLFTDELNQLVGSEYRATVLSVRNMSERVVYSLLLLPISVATGVVGLNSIFLVLGFVAVLGFVWDRRSSRVRAVVMNV